MNAMADLARQNMELWTKMQESMFGAFLGPRGGSSKAAGEAEAEPDPDQEPDEEPESGDARSGKPAR